MSSFLIITFIIFLCGIGLYYSIKSFRESNNPVNLTATGKKLPSEGTTKKPSRRKSTTNNVSSARKKTKSTTKK